MTLSWHELSFVISLGNYLLKKFWYMGRSWIKCRLIGKISQEVHEPFWRWVVLPSQLPASAAYFYVIWWRLHWSRCLPVTKKSYNLGSGCTSHTTDSNYLQIWWFCLNNRNISYQNMTKIKFNWKFVFFATFFAIIRFI